MERRFEMTNNDITQDMMEVITDWCCDGADIACRHLDRMEDVILDEGGVVSDREKLALLREVRELRRELTVFTHEGRRVK